MKIQIIIILSTILLLIIIIIYIFTIYYLKSNQFMNKTSPFECGFIILKPTKSYFSIPFFLVSLLFLLFDVEILILCFFPLRKIFIRKPTLIIIYLIIIIILLSTLYEWKNGIIKWI